MYPVKGLMGGYKGISALMPYYVKVQSLPAFKLLTQIDVAKRYNIAKISGVLVYCVVLSKVLLIADACVGTFVGLFPQARSWIRSAVLLPFVVLLSPFLCWGRD